MVAKLTREQVEAWIMAEGNYCPYCESKSITAYGIDVETWIQEVVCNKCTKTWKEQYKLIGIITEE